MIIYKDKNGKVLSVNNYIEGANAVDISDDAEACKYYEACVNQQVVHADGTVDYSIIPPDPETITVAKLQAKIGDLNEIIDMLILSSLEDSDV